jgi:hypothetical protein
MQFGPDLRTGVEHQQANRLATVAQRQHEQPRALVLPTVRVTDHGACAVIDLGLFAGRGLDHRAGFWRLVWMQLGDEATDALVAGGETGGVHQILPDGHGVAATGEPEFDQVPVGRASACRRAAAGLRFGHCGCTGGQLSAKVGDHLIGRFCGGRLGGGLTGRFCRRRVGDHLVGRFCRRLPSPTAGWAKGDPGGFQIGGRRFATNACLSLDSPQRPAQPPKGDDLLFLLFVQDVTHIAEGIALGSN